MCLEMETGFSLSLSFFISSFEILFFTTNHSNNVSNTRWNLLYSFLLNNFLLHFIILIIYNLIFDGLSYWMWSFCLSHVEVRVIHWSFAPFLYLWTWVWISLFSQIESNFVVYSFSLLIFRNRSVKFIKKVRLNLIITFLSISFHCCWRSLYYGGFIGYKFTNTGFGDWPDSVYSLIVEMFMYEFLNLFEFILMFLMKVFFDLRELILRREKFF